MTVHGQSEVLARVMWESSSEALSDQPDHGGMIGFDFYKDPLGAMKPGLSFDELYRTLSANKPSVTARQRKLLESRYDLTPRLDPNAKMSRGKPLAGGPTARLPQGLCCEAPAAMTP